MKDIMIALFAGLIIGAIFKFFKLPVPVPHGIGGIVGIIGMFIGSEIVTYISNALQLN